MMFWMITGAVIFGVILTLIIRNAEADHRSRKIR